MKAKETFNPDLDAELTFIPSFQETPFVVTGLGESLLPIAEDIKAEAAKPVAAVSHVQPAQTVASIKPAYEDFSTLEPREVLRRKINAFFYDRKNGTQMLPLLKERIADDRDVAMAQRLGIISSVHCMKHQKAVDKLRRML